MLETQCDDVQERQHVGHTYIHTYYLIHICLDFLPGIDRWVQLEGHSLESHEGNNFDPRCKADELEGYE